MAPGLFAAKASEERHTYVQSLDPCSLTYGQDAVHAANAWACDDEERVWQKRGEQYRHQSPPPPKSRALSYRAGQAGNQKLKQAIIVVPEKALARASMMSRSVSSVSGPTGSRAEMNLCDAPGTDNGASGGVKVFWRAGDKVLV